MSTLLEIRSSLSGSAGHSSRLADLFTQEWLRRNRDGRVVTRDLSVDPVPHLTAERFGALLAQPQARTPAQQQVADHSDALIAELRTADVIVLAVPMHNFGVPSTLRAYFDHVARAGVTFRYTASGPEGLIRGKKAYLLITRGGFYPDGADLQTPYLRQFLGFIGIDDIDVIHAEGLAIDESTRQKSLAAARHAIAKLLPVEGSIDTRASAVAA